MAAGSSLFQRTLGSTITIKSAEDSGTDTQTVQYTKQVTQKKNLKYDPAELSSRLIVTKKTENASMVLDRAKDRLSGLKRALVTGEYDEREVRIAITHAKNMVECTRMKIKNLKEEEKIHKQNTREAKDESERKMLKKELQKKRQIHRNNENAKIGEAGMKYLEARMQIHGEQMSMAGSTGIVLELGGTELTALSTFVSGAALYKTQSVFDLTV